MSQNYITDKKNIKSFKGINFSEQDLENLAQGKETNTFKNFIDYSEGTVNDFKLKLQINKNGTIKLHNGEPVFEIINQDEPLKTPNTLFKKNLNTEEKKAFLQNKPLVFDKENDNYFVLHNPKTNSITIESGKDDALLLVAPDKFCGHEFSDSEKKTLNSGKRLDANVYQVDGQYFTCNVTMSKHGFTFDHIKELDRQTALKIQEELNKSKLHTIITTESTQIIDSQKNTESVAQKDMKVSSDFDIPYDPGDYPDGMSEYDFDFVGQHDASHSKSNLTEGVINSASSELINESNLYRLNPMQEHLKHAIKSSYNVDLSNSEVILVSSGYPSKPIPTATYNNKTYKNASIIFDPNSKTGESSLYLTTPNEKLISVDFNAKDNRVVIDKDFDEKLSNHFYPSKSELTKALANKNFVVAHNQLKKGVVPDATHTAQMDSIDTKSLSKDNLSKFKDLRSDSDLCIKYENKLNDKDRTFIQHVSDGNKNNIVSQTKDGYSPSQDTINFIHEFKGISKEDKLFVYKHTNAKPEADKLIEKHAPQANEIKNDLAADETKTKSSGTGKDAPENDPKAGKNDSKKREAKSAINDLGSVANMGFGE